MKVQQSHIPSAGSSGESVYQSSGGPLFSSSIGTATLNFMHLYVAFSSVCVSVLFFPFLIKMPDIGFRFYLKTRIIFHDPMYSLINALFFFPLRLAVCTWDLVQLALVSTGQSD